MSMEIIYEEEICNGELKVILYENYQFKFSGRNYGIRPFDIDWMKNIIDTLKYAYD